MSCWRISARTRWCESWRPDGRCRLRTPRHPGPARCARAAVHGRRRAADRTAVRTGSRLERVRLPPRRLRCGKPGGPGETRSRRLFGKSLVVAQVALSVVLLSAAGLFVRHLSNLAEPRSRLPARSVLLVTLDPARSGYNARTIVRPYRELLGRFEAIPGVRSATLSAVTSDRGRRSMPFRNRGRLPGEARGAPLRLVELGRRRSTSRPSARR